MSVEELAAAGERGKELIYKTDPEARVWYSSAPSLPYGHGLNGIEPAIASGAALSPDSPQDGLDQSLEKMELALTREPENSGRIAVGSVRAAVRYIRSERESEKGIPLQDRAVDPGDLDIEEAMAGFDWIRANVDSDFGKELRYAATEHRKQLNGNNKPRKPLAAAPDTGGRRPSLRQRRAARRQEQKQKQQLENEQRRERHEEDKRAELELLSEWQVENPINGTGHFLRALDLLDSYCSPSGEIVTRPKEGFDARTGSFVGYIARNPEVLEMEIEDRSSIASFLRQNDAPILGSMHRRIYDASDHAWENNLHIDNPDDFKEVFPKWLAILEGLSEDYRSSVEFLNPSGIRVYDANASEIRSTEASIHDRFNTLLQNSLQEMTETHYDDFLDCVHELLHKTLDTGDDFIKDSVLSELHASHVRSGDINMLLTCTSIAASVDQEQKLKSADIIHAMEQSGRKTVLLKSSQFSKKTKSRYIRDLPGYLAKYKISYNDRNGPEKLFKSLMSEFMGAIKAQELPNSLYHRLHSEED